MRCKKRKNFEALALTEMEMDVNNELEKKLKFVKNSKYNSFPRMHSLKCGYTLIIFPLLLLFISFASATIPMPSLLQSPQRDVPHRLAPHKMKLNSHLSPRGPPPTLPIPLKQSLSPHSAHHYARRRGNGGDLDAAAQTLYDLRGFNIPLGGQQETQRFLRQNDPFTFSRPSGNNGFLPNNANPNPNRNLETRTTPLVFPSFYQHQQNENPSNSNRQILNIFGHSQHLQQTNNVPPTTQPIAAAQSQHTFRPSQVDIGFIGNKPGIQYVHEPSQLQGRAVPQFQSQQHQQPQFQAQVQHPQGGQSQQQIINYRAQPQQQQQQQQQNNDDDQFIYVYDDEDYEEGEEDEFDDKPQGQINSNRVTTPTPTPIPTPAPLIRSQPQQTTTPAPIIQHQRHQNDFFNQIQQNIQQVQPQSFRGQSDNYQFPRYNPTITPTPNVEIVPSSERKPPPDQSNVIRPSGPSRIVNDDRFRRPQTSSQLQTPRPSQFNQIVSLEDSEEQIYEEDPEVIQKLSPVVNQQQQQQQHFGNYDDPRPETKLRPVNTLVPKNRVPQEEYVLPPNFYHEETPTGRPLPPPPAQQFEANRENVIRPHNLRPQYQAQSNEQVTQAPQRIRQSPTPTPSRIRPSRPIQSQEVETEAPKRSRTRGRPLTNRVQPQSAFPPFPSSTTTTTSTTTATTTTRRPTTFRTTTTTEAYDAESDEYYEDDYEIPEQKPVSKQKTFSSSTNKSPIRPDFNNNNNRNQNQIQIQEIQEPPRRIRPQTQINVTPTPKSQRFREQSTIESPPFQGKKTTTGKPLYYAGKMLAKEGGVYAGLQHAIPSNHVYGSPVPHIPINSVFDRMPSVLDGHVAKGRGQGQSSSQRTRGNSNREVFGVTQSPTPTVRTSTHPNSRLIHPSRIRPNHNNNAVSPASPPPVERETPRRPVLTPKFTRPQPPVQHLTETEEEEDKNLPSSSTPSFIKPPRRRRIRPGQRFRAQKQEQEEPQQSSVSVSHSVREEEENEDEQDRPEPPRKNLRPNLHKPRVQSVAVTQAPIVQIIQSQSVSSTESSSDSSTTLASKLRPRRPRPGKKPLQLQQKVQVLQSQSQTQSEDEEPQPVARQPPKRIRPRFQKPKVQELSDTAAASVVTQSSVRIGKKPTEAPGRFSSRFREENPVIVTSTHASVSSDDDEDDVGTKHFSPPPKNKPRPSFKPPAKPKPQQQQQTIKPKRINKPAPPPKSEADPDDLLPPTIRLTGKDVVLNRKPARRIPPGSASDRLKALQEKRKKILSPQSFREAQEQEGEEEEDQKNYRTLRRRKLLNHGNRNQENANVENENVEDADIPRPVRPKQRRVVKQRIRPRPQPQREPEEEEQSDYEREEKHDQDRDNFQQNKREIGHSPKLIQQNNVKEEEVKQYDEEYGNGNEDTLEKERVQQGEVRKLINRATGRFPAGEVTSDETRALLGIPNPKSAREVEEEGHLEEHGEEEEAVEAEEPEEVDYEGLPSRQKVASPSSSSTTTTAYDHSSSTTTTTLPSTQASTSTTPTTEASVNLKSRLRPNKKLLASIQPKLSASEQREKNENTRHNNLSKLLKFRTSSSSYTSPFSNSQEEPKKLLSMSTEDPSLPLESMFTKVN